MLGDQLAAQECYVNGLYGAHSGPQALQPETKDPYEVDFTRLEPIDELEEAQVIPF